MDCLQDFYFPNHTESNPAKSIKTVMQSTKALQSKSNDYCEQILLGKKYYNCALPGCGKSFPFKSQFVRHKYTHTTQKPAHCPFPDCNKAFKREDALKNHIRVHTGEKPYKCQEPGCPKSFPCKAGLRYHKLKHKGEKEYKCIFADCNKRFLTLSQLKQHEKTLIHPKNRLEQGLFNESQEDIVDNIRKNECQGICKKEDVESGVNFVKEPEWPTSNEDYNYNTHHEKNLNEGFEQEFKRMVEFLSNENNTIKMRIGMCNKLKELLENNKLENNFDGGNLKV